MIDRIEAAIKSSDKARLYAIGMELGINCTEVSVTLSAAVPWPLRQALDNGLEDGRKWRQRLTTRPYDAIRPADWRPLDVGAIKR